MRMRTTAAVAAAAALLVAGTAGGAAATAPPHSPAPAGGVPRGPGALTAQTLPPGAGRLFDTVQPDAHTVWAAGMWQTSTDGKAARDTPLLLARDDRDGSGWHEMTLPRVAAGNEINALAVVPGSGGRDAWAVGLADSSTGDGLPGRGEPGPILADHWDGSAWRSLPVPLPAKSEWGGLTSVTALAADDVWAVGWAQILDSATPDPDKPGGWIVDDHFEALAEHWDGHAWQRVTVPGEQTLMVNGITATGPDDLWAAGWDGSDDTPVVQHWDGASWTSQKLPPTGLAGEIYQLAPDGRGGLWAVGRTVLDEDDPGHALVLHRVAGRWRKVAVPADAGQLSSVAVTPGGITVTGNEVVGFDGYAMRLAGGRWTRLALPATGGHVYLGGVSWSRAQGLVLTGDSEPDAGILAATPLVLTGR